MFDLRGVEVAANEFAGIGLGEGEDGALNRWALGEAPHGREGVSVGVGGVGGVARGEVCADELRGCGVDGAAECFELTGLFSGMSVILMCSAV